MIIVDYIMSTRVLMCSLIKSLNCLSYQEEELDVTKWIHNWYCVFRRNDEVNTRNCDGVGDFHDVQSSIIKISNSKGMVSYSILQ